VLARADFIEGYFHELFKVLNHFFSPQFVFFLHNQFTAGIPVLLPKGVTDSLEASAGFK